MRCPACGNDLREKTVGDLTVDVCEGGCGGVWFDAFELKKVDEPTESLGIQLLDVPRDESLVLDPTRKRTCPRCEGMTLMRHFFSVKCQIEVDECPKCAGVWLDHEELAKIRSLFGSEAEAKQAAREYFAEAFGPELAAVAARSDRQTRKAEKFARMFRFLCPSFYLPGKQDWGAF